MATFAYQHANASNGFHILEVQREGSFHPDGNGKILDDSFLVPSSSCQSTSRGTGWIGLVAAIRCTCIAIGLTKTSPNDGCADTTDLDDFGINGCFTNLTLDELSFHRKDQLLDSTLN